MWPSVSFLATDKIKNKKKTLHEGSTLVEFTVRGYLFVLVLDAGSSLNILFMVPFLCSQIV